MNTVIRKLAKKYVAGCQKAMLFVERHSTMLMLTLGVGILVVGLSEISHAQTGLQDPNFDDGDIRGAVGLLFELIEGAFGALIMVVAGLGAIVAAAVGAYRAALGMLTVAVGAFILRALVSLFFGTDFDSPAGGGGGSGGTRIGATVRTGGTRVGVGTSF